MLWFSGESVEPHMHLTTVHGMFVSFTQKTCSWGLVRILQFLWESFVVLGIPERVATLSVLAPSTEAPSDIWLQNNDLQVAYNVLPEPI